MGFLSSSVSFTRYRILEDVSQDLWLKLPDLLLDYSFQDIDHTADERSFGWVSIDNMLDNKWATASPFKGEYIAFALRLDTRRIPPAVFKKHFNIALEEQRLQNKKQNKAFLSRDQKREIKERVRSQLLSRTLPVPAIFDVIWNMSSNIIYFASIQDKAKSLFEELFIQTFELHLEPATPYFWALHLLGSEYKHNLDKYKPNIFV